MPSVRFLPRTGHAARRAARLGLLLILSGAATARGQPATHPVPPVADPAAPVPAPAYRSAFGHAGGGVEHGRADWRAANAAVAPEARAAAHPHAAHGRAAPAEPAAQDHRHPHAPPPHTEGGTR